MGDVLQIGVIGCGGISIPHVQTLESHCGEVHLHLYDRDPNAARALAARTRAPVDIHDDIDQMLAECNLDVVHILTPPDSHFQLAKKALLAGCHVLVEKPLTMTLAESEELFEIAGRSNRIVTVDHSVLLMPCVQKAMKLLASGKIGRPIAFHCYFGNANKRGSIPYEGSDHWAYSMKGGPLLNLISHPASMAVEIFGPPTEISFQKGSRNVMPGDLPDSVQVSFRSDNGYGSFMISMAHGNAARQVRIWCESGTMVIDLGRQTLLVEKHHGPLSIVYKTIGGVMTGIKTIWSTCGVIVGVATGRVKRDPGLRRFVQQFYGGLRAGGPPPVSKENALATAQFIDMVLMAEEASERHPPVVVGAEPEA